MVRRSSLNQLCSQFLFMVYNILIELLRKNAVCSAPTIWFTLSDPVHQQILNETVVFFFIFPGIYNCMYMFNTLASGYACSSVEIEACGSLHYSSTSLLTTISFHFSYFSSLWGFGLSNASVNHTLLDALMRYVSFYSNYMSQ